MADNNFDFYHSIERYKEHRVGALEAFCADYNTKDYWFAELPKLPYADDSFDLVLSSHLLFVYDDRLDFAFHEASITEMLRIGKEVRIFPLVDYKNSRVDKLENLSPFAYQIAEKLGGEIVKVGLANVIVEITPIPKVGDFAIIQDPQGAVISMIEYKDVLSIYKLAKWSILTLIHYYYARDKEFFIKPTTTKDIIRFFEIEGIMYKPRPTYEFYERYKKVLEEMKSQVSPLIGQDNAGFTGFLMMAMK